MKKTLELTLCESEGVKIEVSCEVLRIETDNPAIHPDDPNQGTITEYWCQYVDGVLLDGFPIASLDLKFHKHIANKVEELLESNPELFNEG